MELSYIVSLFCLSMFITTIAVIEIRNLKYAVYAYCLQAIIMAVLYFYLASHINPRFFVWFIEVVVVKIVLIPMFFLIYIRRTTQIAFRPFIGYIPSVFLMAFIIIIMFYMIYTNINFIAPSAEAVQDPGRTLLSVSLTVFTLGLYGILTRRDAIKMVLSLCVVDNGVHLFLVSTALSMPEIAVIGITTDAVIAVLLLLYLVRGIFNEFGSADTNELKNLRW